MLSDRLMMSAVSDSTDIGLGVSWPGEVGLTECGAGYDLVDGPRGSGYPQGRADDA
jgi:hypothetical protein